MSKIVEIIEKLRNEGKKIMIKLMISVAYLNDNRKDIVFTAIPFPSFSSFPKK
jgi:hypothetical protein